MGGWGDGRMRRKEFWRLSSWPGLSDTAAYWSTLLGGIPGFFDRAQATVKAASLAAADRPGAGMGCRWVFLHHTGGLKSACSTMVHRR
jgi:hypothetical protein